MCREKGLRPSLVSKHGGVGVVGSIYQNHGLGGASRRRLGPHGEGRRLQTHSGVFLDVKKQAGIKR